MVRFILSTCPLVHGDQPEQELSGDGGGGLLMQLDEGELRGAVDGDEHVQLALFSPHLGDIDVEVADRVALERLLRGPVAFNIGQPADAMALQAAVQRRPRQVRDRRLQGIEAVIERQQRIAPESDDDRLLLYGKNRRPRLFWPRRQIGYRVRFFHFATVFWLIP
jgi:hypothetical protein